MRRRHESALEAFEAELERIEARRIDRQLGWIGKDDEHRRFAEDAPGHAFVDQDAAQSGLALNVPWCSIFSRRAAFAAATLIYRSKRHLGHRALRMGRTDGQNARFQES